MVTFPPEVTHTEFNISITNDDQVEGMENFYLIISSSSLPMNITVDDPHQATVTIEDDDGKSLTFCINKITV